MRKGIIYLTVFSLARFLILLFANKSVQINLNASILGFNQSTALNKSIASITGFSNPFFNHNSFETIVLATILFLVFQTIFLLLLSKIVRNDKKYLIWIMLISSIVISPWMNISFYELCFGILWLGAIYSFYEAIFCSKPYYWILSSILIGIGFTIKSYMAAIPIGVIVFLIFSTKYRFYIFSYKPYLMIVIGFIIAFIFTQNWLGFELNIQQAKAFESNEITGLHPSYFLNFTLSQFVILMPVLFVGMWWLLFKYFGRIVNKPNQVNSEFWFLLCFFIPMYLGVYIISFFYKTPPDQLLPIYLVGLIIFGKLMKKRWIYWHIALNLIVYGILICAPFFL